VNDYHLTFCASDEWADALQQWILPSALEGVDLGDDVLEIGPGPGRTTDLLMAMTPRLTAVEVDPELAQPLAARMQGTNVEVVNADAADMPFDDGRISGAVSFIMLHHVPTAEQQDAIFAELARVLRPGAVFAGVDSPDTEAFREMHVDDVCNPLPASTLEARLRAAGFADARVNQNDYVIEFRAAR
jgi:ubiquinone/menaquinone biosynthesis C-methylase UbiE